MGHHCLDLLRFSDDFGVVDSLGLYPCQSVHNYFVFDGLDDVGLKDWVDNCWLVVDYLHGSFFVLGNNVGLMSFDCLDFNGVSGGDGVFGFSHFADLGGFNIRD